MPGCQPMEPVVSFAGCKRSRCSLRSPQAEAVWRAASASVLPARPGFSRLVVFLVQSPPADERRVVTDRSVVCAAVSFDALLRTGATAPRVQSATWTDSHCSAAADFVAVSVLFSHRPHHRYDHPLPLACLESCRRDRWQREHPADIFRRSYLLRRANAIRRRSPATSILFARRGLIRQRLRGF